MLLVRSIIFDALLYSSMLVIGILGAPLALWSADGAARVCRTYCRTTFWLLRVICGLRVEVRGTPPHGDVLVAAKHQSFLDILMIFEALPRAKFIMKKELRWAPILGLYAMRIGSTPVSRGDRSKAMKAMVDHAGQAEGARQLVIYPQGTRVAPGARPPFKVGAGGTLRAPRHHLRSGGDQRRGVLGPAQLQPQAGPGGGRVPRTDPARPAHSRVHGADGAGRRDGVRPADAGGRVRSRPAAVRRSVTAAPCRDTSCAAPCEARPASCPPVPPAARL